MGTRSVLSKYKPLSDRFAPAFGSIKANRYPLPLHSRLIGYRKWYRSSKRLHAANPAEQAVLLDFKDAYVDGPD